MLRLLRAIVLGIIVRPPEAAAYPLDGAARTGIRRLEGYRRAQEREGGPKLPPGALLPTEGIRLHLAGASTSWDPATAAKDSLLQEALDAVFEGRDPSYGAVAIDITDPERIAWAGRRENESYQPGSVHKVLCVIALFDGLARAFPDTARREAVLRETVIEATDWVVSDAHEVPHYDETAGRNRYRVIRPGDRFALSEWIDHMLSPSANAAGAVVWKEAILLRQFGGSYPVDRETEEAFFRTTPKSALQQLSQLVIDEPLEHAGIDTRAIQQGSMWTRTGKQKIPGLPSYTTPLQLARILLRLEQGRLVDRWSSLEMKRYLYMTKKRYRYVYAPELRSAAVYFKSGSLYSCKAEPGFRCGRYTGNVRNFMNSVAIVESPAQRGPEQRRYIVALLSNVLRKNSAWDHARLGAAVEEAIRTRHRIAVREEGTAAEIRSAGEAR